MKTTEECKDCGAKTPNWGRSTGCTSWAYHSSSPFVFCWDCAAQREVEQIQAGQPIGAYVCGEENKVTIFPGRVIGKVTFKGIRKKRNTPSGGYYTRQLIRAIVGGVLCWGVQGEWDLVVLKPYKRGVL